MGLLDHYVGTQDTWRWIKQRVITTLVKVTLLLPFGYFSYGREEAFTIFLMFAYPVFADFLDDLGESIYALFDFEEMPWYWGLVLRTLCPLCEFKRILGFRVPVLTRKLSRAQQRKLDRQESNLPMLVYLTKEELGTKSDKELRSLLANVTSNDAGAAAFKQLSKQQLVEKIPHRTQFTGDECIICGTEYESGEVLVALNCQHSYHGPCITSWFAERRKLSMPKACPICNAV